MPSPYVIARPLRRAWNKLLWKISPPRTKAKADRQSDGLAGEDAAARYLKTFGYKILVRRFRSAFGEIDLVCRDGDSLVFVEVKSLHSLEATRPSDAVGAEKQRRLSRAALDYLKRLGHPQISARFDVVEVAWEEPRPAFNLIRDAFSLAQPYSYS